MKASLTLREDPKTPILKAKIPLNILGVPFCSGIEAGDPDELSIGFSTAFRSGPLLKFCYRPNDSRSPFGLILKTGIGKFGSPSGSPISMTAEFGLIGNDSRPGFLLGFKSRSGDFSMRRSAESPPIDLFSSNSKSMLSQNDVVKGLSWNRLFSGACGALSDGEVCARTSATVNRVAVKLGWSMRFPTPLAEVSGGGSRAEVLLGELPYLVLRKIAIEHVAGDETGKEWRDSRGKSGDVAEAPGLSLNRELSLPKSEISLWKREGIKDVKLERF
ncbi:hypothetical protein PHJA_001457500 [Phtheirospermum japonicum]|uniref:Uncharacterized protein n=1 Tax=Phtheirospermum japonicum TaxID=374723 RepID=A0A830C4P7_9LAMI|nr:hypothetical protein PHJA_001457500 [Phtheirospermum japonicum]